ncbi:hypothetical protein [Brachybacterium vulturis]|uniref:hypothetical protein n=1 Tax=Brachybacterium vulturis TaxID=2017484 RepID=UPI003735135C
MTLPPHDPSSPPSPAAQVEWGRPSSAPQGGGDDLDPAGPARTPGSGPVPGSDLGADLGAALSFAGRALLWNPVTYLVSGLIYCVVSLLIVGGGVVGGFFAMFAFLGGPDVSDSDELAGMLAFYGVFLVAMLLLMPFALLWQSGAARAAGIVREGGPPSITQAMVGPMRVVLTALLYGAIVLLGTLLLYLPGLIAAALFLFAIPAALRGATPVAAMKESLALVKENLGTAIVSYLVLMVITSIASTIVIPLLVLTPFLMLFQLGLYERLNGRRLPEPATV